MENIENNEQKEKLELELSTQIKEENSSDSDSDDFSTSESENVSSTNVTTTTMTTTTTPVTTATGIERKPGVGRGKNYVRTPAREAQFAASKIKRREAAKQRKLEMDKEKQVQAALLEIEKMKVELKRREILQEAERLRNLVQTAPSVSLTTNPNSVDIVQTQVDIPAKSETKMSNNTQFKLEIDEVPVKAVIENDKRGNSELSLCQEKYEEEYMDDARDFQSLPPRASHSTFHPVRVERFEEPERYSAANRVRESVRPTMVDDEDTEYAEILAEAKRVVAERRRTASQRVATEPIPIQQERVKIHRPSEASRYLEHTQTTANQQFTQRVMPKASNEGFIWL